MAIGGADPAPQGFSFLFRTDQGRIGRAVWWRGTIGLLLVLGVLSALWRLLEPYANRTVEVGQRLFDPMTFVAFTYLLFYAVAVMLIAVCHYNLSAKRWRDRGRIGGLAGLLPAAALFAGAAHWLQPRVADVMPPITVTLFDAVLLGIVVWNIVELGTLDKPAQ
jgi:uncharacterized membrane protein YhaH (DUF805 family)